MYAGALLLLWSSVLGHWSALSGVFAVVASALVAVRITDEDVDSAGKIVFHADGLGNRVETEIANVLIQAGIW